ncbi:MAG: hypothetical protein HF973_03705 [Chloroflexi bacterium]|nr:hypothetical protein [Chloroflexota bacterium]
MKKMIVLFLGLSLMVALAACGGTAAETGAVAVPVEDVSATAVADVVTVVEEAPVEVEAAATAVPVETSEETAVAETTDVVLAEDYAEDALPIRTQLILGTMKLEDTDLAVTPEQAAELVILWQASAALSRSGTGATEEVTAVINQIQDTMTPAQISAIAAMQLTRGDIQTLAQELGVSSGGDGTGQGGGGQGQNLTEAERATRQAERAESSSKGVSSVLLDMLIEMLVSRSGA